jgi:predicted membrane protein
VGAGEITVFVPPTADVTVRAHADLGDVEFGGAQQGGPDVAITVIDDLGTDGVRSGRPIVLDLQTGFGAVGVHRG